MNEICQLAHSVSTLKSLIFSLTGLLAFVGLAGAYFYVGFVKKVINKTIALINSILGLFGAGVIIFLFFADKFLC